MNNILNVRKVGMVVFLVAIVFALPAIVALASRNKLRLSIGRNISKSLQTQSPYMGRRMSFGSGCFHICSGFVISERCFGVLSGSCLGSWY